MTDTAAIRAHWDKQAALGTVAGTQDLLLKQLEHGAILTSLKRIGYHAGVGLEVGCGRGELARMAAEEFKAKRFIAVDSSPAMIAEAMREACPGNLSFAVDDVCGIPGYRHRCDVVYSERCLINLPTWEEQQQAINNIAGMLLSGGRFLMCEHSQDGLDAINRERERLGLGEIERPWHNRYFRDDELATIASLKLIARIPFSATYYFLSRVINAALAAKEGREPQYDAPINALALTLPYTAVDARFAQGLLWVWEKP